MKQLLLLERQDLENLLRENNGQQLITDEQLDKLVHVMLEKLTSHVEKYFERDRPMNTAQAAAFLGVSRTTLHRMVTKGIVKGHTPEGFATFFFPSELIAGIKSR